MAKYNKIPINVTKVETNGWVGLVTNIGYSHFYTHWRKLVKGTYIYFPNSEFYTIGEHQVKNSCLMLTLGSFDSQDGLGVLRYIDLIDLSIKTVQKLLPETSCNFEYSNSFYILLDVTSPIADQSQLHKKQLSARNGNLLFDILHHLLIKKIILKSERNRDEFLINNKLILYLAIILIINEIKSND